MLQDRRTAHLALVVPTQGRSRLFFFLGPAALVSVGYMDPGNWATDLEGGARFGYQLLWVLVVSNIFALLLQTLATRFGAVTGLDLAQACRTSYSKSVARALWILAELAIIACDLAEVLGSAIALNLLFGIPMIWGALLTALDAFLILALQRYGVRMREAIIVVLIFTIAVCLGIELWVVQPKVRDIATGFMPRLDANSLYIAIGILGATVMPHNLYLHSSLVKTREIEPTSAGKKEALRAYFIDTALALNVALLINAAILILSAAVFASRNIPVTDIREAHHLLTPLLGTAAASTLFAVALLAAGQSSTITGTLAGQIILEGFVNLRLPPLLRRMVTRLSALVPVVGTLAFFGEESTLPLLVGSQVILSLQLPFAVVPLMRLTGSSALMGDFMNRPLIKVLAIICAALIITANGALIARVFLEWEHCSMITAFLAVSIVSGAGLLLAWISLVPLRVNSVARCIGASVSSIT
ncbi:MAG: Nramp family divalent metal transporter [Pseudomonadota bacterium]